MGKNPRLRRRRAGQPKELVSAESLCRDALGRMGYAPEDYGVFEIWDRLLGREAAKARVLGLQGERLVVEADSSARLQDLTLRKRTLLKKINGHFGTRRPISDIIIRLKNG